MAAAAVVGDLASYPAPVRVSLGERDRRPDRLIEGRIASSGNRIVLNVPKGLLDRTYTLDSSFKKVMTFSSVVQYTFPDELLSMTFDARYAASTAITASTSGVPDRDETYDAELMSRFWPRERHRLVSLGGGAGKLVEDEPDVIYRAG